ncbi:WD40/YVTN/BNR-like repeat-containing protein [Cohnella terricola]|uniref:Sortilin N-terminal domain-containing protein n=1 Tax=Cohnella terricola TaxID=1289167 RepID=A0A559JKS0_9BACL|nr:hypothetical protein [Cohnella terricola]TVY00472.1 hypothetical protein FPZ45_10610 [Cohnella terricola]
MKTFLDKRSVTSLAVVLLAFVVVLVGCGQTLPLSTPDSSPSASVSIDTVEDTFYLNESEGWRVDLTPTGMFHEEFRIYKTNDGGETFQLVNDSQNKGSKTPGGMLAGMAFIDSDHGWIIANAPWQGKIGLFRTKDGGVSWDEQRTGEVPKAFADLEIQSDSLAFLDAQTGLILAHVPMDNKISLFYLTTDAGETWHPMADKLEGSAEGLDWTFERNPNGSLQGKVRYNHDEWETGKGVWKREFLPGVFMTEDQYASDSKKKKLAGLVIENLKTIIAKDWQGFGANMVSPDLTDAMLVVFDNSNKYRFIRIDQIYPLGDDPNRMNVNVVAEEQTEDGTIRTRNITYTLRPDKKGDWHIAAID